MKINPDSKKKLRNLIKLVLEQATQEISLEDESGKIIKYKSNSPEWSKFYYSPEFKQYKWDGKKYVVDYSKIIKNWNNMTQQQKNDAITQRRRVKSSGSYKENTNLITSGLNPIGNISDWFHNIADYVSLSADFIIPGSGAIIDILNTIVYLIEYLLTTDINNKNDLLLITAVSGLFIFVPGPAQLIAPKIKQFIKTKQFETGIKKIFESLLSYVDGMVIDLQGKVTEALKSPIASKIINKLNSFGNIQQILRNFSSQLKSYLNNLIAI
jgi:hypothetical protein